jgi:chitinase
MQLKNSLVAAALAVSPVQAHGSGHKSYKLNTYWGQNGVGDNLAQYCAQQSVDYVTLAFVNNSPEHGNGTDYPGTNFAAHCSDKVYINNGRNSLLLSGCDAIKEDIQTCQQLGKKVLLSIGGEYSATSNYAVSTVQKGKDFADFLWEAFGPYKQGYTGPRPFDRSSTDHTCIDGFDFDIERKFPDQTPYIALVNRLRDYIEASSKNIVLTAAPQCPLTEEYFQMKQILTEAKFDKIWIQFYNNPSCNVGAPGFNYHGWESFLKNTNSKDAELFIGLPASPAAASNGYITPQAAKEVICSVKDTTTFGGVMLWDAYFGSKNVVDGKPYYDHIAKALQCGGCGETDCPVAPPTGSGPGSTTSTTASASTTSSSTSHVSAGISNSASTSVFWPNATLSHSDHAPITLSHPTFSLSNTLSASATTTASTTGSHTGSASVTASHTGSDDVHASNTDSATGPNGAHTTGSSTSSVLAGSGSQTTSSSGAAGASTTGSSDMTTSVVQTTVVYTVTSCLPHATACPGKGAVVTETIPLYTTVCPVTEVHKPTNIPLTTSTIYATKVATITKCPPTVANCPIGSVTTQTVAVGTTLCPVSTPPSKPTDTPLTTATVYTTKVSTITKCAPNVVNCPTGSVTTQTISVGTTVYPVSDKPKTTPAGTPTGGKGGNGDDDKPKTTATATATGGKGGAGDNDKTKTDYTTSTVYKTIKTDTPTVTTYPAGGKNYTVSATGSVTVTESKSTGASSTPVPTNVEKAGSAKTAALSLGGLIFAVALAI